MATPGRRTRWAKDGNKEGREPTFRAGPGQCTDWTRPAQFGPPGAGGVARFLSGSLRRLRSRRHRLPPSIALPDSSSAGRSTPPSSPPAGSLCNQVK
ncbi:hypothetical protein Taro_019987 [Colocasia esculenta]|uniref:Uncharacterized protein n=1 Tax=Colocasia esculenta TaxID=4460 RepID=A0A843V762_COLES|nr:hypothetical protein [Colocasia esculenta]